MKWPINHNKHSLSRNMLMSYQLKYYDSTRMCVYVCAAKDMQIGNCFTKQIMSCCDETYQRRLRVRETGWV